VSALPAATLVLLRDAPDGQVGGQAKRPEDGLEVLLVRRHARAGFVPGAYVFPGGVLDAADAAEAALAHLDGLTPERAAERLGLVGAEPPAVAYYVAALRETFEETGILVAVGPGGLAAHASARDDAVRRAREDLLEDRVGFAEVLERLRCRLDGGGLEYIAHWITPVSEPRRYDTRFFMAVVPSDAEPVADPREMTDALWIRPADAVLGAAEARLPMITPTVRTLEGLAGYRGAEEAFRSLAGLPVPTILPAFATERNALPPRPERSD
jgi:8-oxo-dGTP pyrophosphatase MutT (NUDIX family)